MMKANAKGHFLFEFVTQRIVSETQFDSVIKELKAHAVDIKATSQEEADYYYFY